jgi:hypothetical protein
MTGSEIIPGADDTTVATWLEFRLLRGATQTVTCFT